MEAEFDALRKNQTWRLVRSKSGQNIIASGCTKLKGKLMGALIDIRLVW
jgi:hypothetical protein